MRAIKEISEAAKSGLKTGGVNLSKNNHDLQGEIPQIIKDFVDKIFSQLVHIFPGSKAALKTDRDFSNAKKEWVKAFFENGIDTDEKVRAGLIHARRSTSDFLPSPGKFISWCEIDPTAAGWPSIDDALRQCIEHRANKLDESKRRSAARPLVIELCKKVDWWMMNQSTTNRERDDAKNHFREKYNELLKSGYKEPERTDFEQLPDQEAVKKGMSKEQKAVEMARALKHIQAMKDILNSRGKEE